MVTWTKCCKYHIATLCAVGVGNAKVSVMVAEMQSLPNTDAAKTAVFTVSCMSHFVMLESGKTQDLIPS